MLEIQFKGAWFIGRTLRSQRRGSGFDSRSVHMKLEFFYSEVYFRHLNKQNTAKRTWNEVKSLGKQFENKYESEISKIIKLIPDIVGKHWRKQVTEVYVVDWNGPSFSHPLTLNVREDLLLMLVTLTHELLHDFYLNETDIEKVELTINNNVKEVFDELNIDVSEQLKILQGFHDKRFGK